MLSFSEGQYHSFRDDGTVALTSVQTMEVFSFLPLYGQTSHCIHGSSFALCDRGPRLHALRAGFSTMDQSQLTGRKEVLFVKE